MPAQSPPQPSAPALSEKPARKGTLFHLLVERGWDAAVAYTADQRIHTMTSDIVAAGLRPVLEELRQVRETMATKTELQAELRQVRETMATKTELQAELRQIRETMAGFATKEDLTDLRREMAEREARLLKWMFGAMLAQTAVIVGLVVGVVPLLR